MRFFIGILFLALSGSALAKDAFRFSCTSNQAADCIQEFAKEMQTPPGNVKVPEDKILKCFAGLGVSCQSSRKGHTCSVPDKSSCYKLSIGEACKDGYEEIRAPSNPGAVFSKLRVCVHTE